MMLKSKIVDKSFSERLAYGQETERLALETIKDKYDDKAYLMEGLDKAKDIVAPTMKTLIEVKDQRTAIKCLSVEFARISPDKSWRYSGLKTTKADYWMWFCKGEFLVINTSWLYGLAKEKPTKIYPHRGEKYAFKIVEIKSVKSLADYVWTPRLQQAVARL